MSLGLLHVHIKRIRYRAPSGLALYSWQTRGEVIVSHAAWFQHEPSTFAALTQLPILFHVVQSASYETLAGN